MELATPGSAVRHASVARYVTDCATRPDTKEDDKATLVNNFFVAQTELDETKATISPDIPVPEHSINILSTSPLAVETVLKSLNLGKATGPDAINNRALK